jgi:hypothetical protein
MKKIATLLLILPLLKGVSSIAQVLPDEKLYEKGYNEVQNRRWPTAAAYLYAYIQRNPVIFVTDKNYEKQIKDAYFSSFNNIESEKNSLLNEINRLNTKIKNLEARLGGPASTSQGLSWQPNVPSLRAPAEPIMIRSRIITPIKGQWLVTLTSSSGSRFTGTLIIVTNEDVVNGTLGVSDNSGKKVIGMYDGDNLMLMRNTGKTTIQTYALKKLDENHFSGFYKNEGTAPDDGQIELARQ